MLVTSIFSFSHNVLYSIKNRNHYFVICNCFQFGLVKNFAVWLMVNLVNKHSHVVTPPIAFKIILGKGEDVGNQPFILYQQCYLFVQSGSIIRTAITVISCQQVSSIGEETRYISVHIVCVCGLVRSTLH